MVKSIFRSQFVEISGHIIAVYVHVWVLLFTHAYSCEDMHTCQYILRGASNLGNEHLHISVFFNARMSLNYILCLNSY